MRLLTWPPRIHEERPISYTCTAINQRHFQNRTCWRESDRDCRRIWPLKSLGRPWSRACESGVRTFVRFWWQVSIKLCSYIARMIHVRTDKDRCTNDIKPSGFAGVKDVSIHFTKGPLASVAVREIALKLPLVKLNLSALRESKLQLCVSEVDLLLQKPGKSRHRSVSQHKSREQTKLPGQSKAWPIIAKCVKHFNLTVSELVVKVVELPDLSVEIKVLDLDTFKSEDTTLDLLGLRLLIAPVNILVRDLQPDCNGTDMLERSMTPENCPTLFSLEQFYVSSTIEYVKDRGLLLHQVEVNCGEAEVNLSEEMLFGDNSLVRRLLRKKSDGKDDIASVTPTEEGQDLVVRPAVEKPAGTRGKGPALLPEKFGFNLPMVSFNCSRLGGGSTLKSKISGISIQSCTSKPADPAGEIARVCDMHFNCGEIQILEENDGSLFQVLRVSVVATIELYPKVNCRQRVEIDVYLEGTRCNLFQNRVDDLLKFVLRLSKNTSKVERFVDQSSPPLKKKKSKSKLCWVCTISVPEMGATAYDSMGRRVFTVTSQSLQFFVDNVSGPACRMQLEVGELQVMMIDGLYDEFNLSKESKASCFIRLGGLVMEWGTSELVSEEDKIKRSCSVIILECSQIGLYLSIVRLKTLLTIAAGVKAYVTNVFGQKMKPTSTSAVTTKPKKKGGWRKIEFGVQGLLIEFSGPALVDEGEVVDPKSLNLGDQGGRIVMTHNQDGVLRTASIKSRDSHHLADSNVLCKATFDEVFGLVSIDGHKTSLQFFLDRGQVSHEQVGTIGKVISNITMLAVQNLEVLFEGGSREMGVPGRLLLSVTNVDGYWDPDVHLFYYDVALQLAVIGGSMSGNFKNEGAHSSGEKRDIAAKKKVAATKQKLRLAVDLEKLNFTAKITEEINFAVRVQSLVSEDAEIGLLVENIHAAFKDCQVLHVEQAQICRLPSSTPDAVSGLTGAAEKVYWNVSVNATKIRTILPFRLQLRVIDDAIEDMWRVLKLVMRAQNSKRKRAKVTGGHQKTKKHAAGIQSILVSVHELSFEIEEEPLQGWLDEHYHLMGREVCKLQVQERILEEKRQEAVKSESFSHDTSSQEFDSEWERIQKEAFTAYRRACENLVVQEGSGACKSGRQSGFRVSDNRRALLLVRASNVEMNLSPVTGSMIEAIRKLDCVGPDVQVPYQKVYGRHLSIQASTLVAQLRDFPSPLVKTDLLECEGNVIVAQQATIFPQQIRQEVNLGRLRIVEVWRSVSGSSPAYKTFFDLDLQADSGEFSYGVGYEPVIADMSYAFSIALQKAKPAIPVVKKERSLPWWDDMRYYIHGRNSLKVNNFTWSCLATTNPYEDQRMLQFVATTMDITQSEGSVVFRADEFEWVISRCSSCQSNALVDHQEKLSVLHAPEFKLEIIMDWKSESGKPLFHYLHPFPDDPNPPTKKYDLFRSTSLSLTFSFSLFCPSASKWNPTCPSERFAATKGKVIAKDSSEKPRTGRFLGRTASHHSEMPSDALHEPVPTIYFGSQELKWIFRIWNLFYSPPQKLRQFSRWPRFGIKRNPRSGNLSLDKVTTEYLLRVDATPGCIKHRSNLDVDPAHGLTFRMKRLRYELLYSRCQSHFESTGPREPLISVYQGLDLSMLNARMDTVSVPTVRSDLAGDIDKEDKVKELLGLQEGFVSDQINDSVSKSKQVNGKGFLLSMDCFTLRKQAPKAGLSQLSALLHYKRITRCNGAAAVASEGIGVESGGDQSHSDASDDEGFNVVLADNCLRVSVYGLKLLWTLPNRDAVWSWVEDFSRAFQSSKPSPSRQYAQRKVLEMKEKWAGEKSDIVSKGLNEKSVDTSEEEGVMHFMVNVVQPQFNLHSEDAHGRLLLAAASGRVLARSFHSIVAVGLDIIAQALRKEGVPTGPQGGAPVIAWKRRELSVILEHVQAHVAPTDVDLGAGLQWLPKIPTGAPKVRRTGALLERVFMPCSMYIQYTRHKGGTTDCKVKPLKELSFNSPNITATMTSNQFHIMVDVISNLLLARLPKPRERPSVQYVGDENSTDEGEEEVDEVVPEGVEEVEIARIKLEQAERDCCAVIAHWVSIKRLGFEIQSAEIQILEREFTIRRMERRSAFLTLRDTLKSAAQQRLMEKEKHRTPLAAMRISWAIDKFVWSMLCDGESFAEAEINSLILNVDRDFNDIGVARFTTKSFAVKNCLPDAKSSTVLSPWNPPAEWGRNVMLRVDAKQGAPEDGHSPLELFQVEIYPLKIYLTEGMYTMMWDYLFPEEDNDSVQRQTIRIQHQKVSMSVGNATTSNQVRITSFSKSVEEKEIDVTTDEVNSKATIMRVSNSCNEELQSTATIHSTNSVESVKSKEQKSKKASKLLTQEEKKITEEKKVSRLQKSLLEFHNIRISQVELLVTYEGSRFSVNDMRLLMDTFTRSEFTGSWRRLFSKVKKHIIWSVLKSVTGMQGKKFKDKLPVQNQADGGEGPMDSNSSDSSTSQPGHEDQFPISRFRKHSDRAGEGFVSSIRGLFNSQRRKAKALVMRKLSIDLRNSTESLGYLSGPDEDSATSPQDFGSLTKAKRLIQRHSRKLRSSGSQKGGSFRLHSQSQSSSSSSPIHVEAELSDDSSADEEFHELG